MSQSEDTPLKEKGLAIPLSMDASAFLYNIPKDYFSNFPQLLMQDILLMESDEKTLDLSKAIPYNLKSDYFENFTNQVLELIKIDDQETELFANNLPKQIPFSIPENYFASFETELFQKFNIEFQEQLEEPKLSPILAGLKNKQAFEVPEDYFEKPQEKTIAFKPKTAQRSIKWMRWAAAAMVIAIFSLGGWQFLNNNVVNTNENYASVKQEINKISDADIKEYLNATLNDYDVAMLAQNMDLSANPLDGISKDELKDYLDEGAY